MKQWDTITGKYITQDGITYAVELHNQAMPTKKDRTLDEIVTDLEKQIAHYKLMQQLCLPTDELRLAATQQMLDTAKAVARKIEGDK